MGVVFGGVGVLGVFCGGLGCFGVFWGDSMDRLLNVYCEIFGTSLYSEGRTSLRVHLRHMNE